MKKFRVTYETRVSGAIGIFEWDFRVELNAENSEEALYHARGFFDATFPKHGKESRGVRIVEITE